MALTPTFLHLNLREQTSSVVSDEELVPRIGGLGWALALYEKHLEEDPLIFAIGPLSGIFPGASKTVAVFRSPQTKGLEISLGGGHLARHLRFAGFQGILITGKAARPTRISVDEEEVEFREAASLSDLLVPKAFELLFLEGIPGRRSILLTGPAAERGFTFSPLYLDEFFSFPRGGLGTAFAQRHLKALTIGGAKSEPIAHPRRFEEVFARLMEDLRGYRELSRWGTLRNLALEKKISGVPFENLREPNFEGEELSAENFAAVFEAKRIADGGCPVGYTHLARREETYTPYDYEGVVSLGPLLGLTTPKDILPLLEKAWAWGFDPVSLGAILAFVTEKEKLAFGNGEAYRDLIEALVAGKEDWAKELKGGLPLAPNALTLAGQEFLPYFNGYASVASQALRLGATTEDNRGYLLDLELLRGKINPTEVVTVLVEAEEKKTLGQLLVGSGYLAPTFEDPAVAFSALEALGAPVSHEALQKTAGEVFRHRLRLQKQLEFSPRAVTIPQRFFEVPSPQGYLERKILEEMIEVYTNDVFEKAG